MTNAELYSDYATDCMTKELYLVHGKACRPALGLTLSPVHLASSIEGWGLKLTIHFHLALSLRLHGATLICTFCHVPA